MKHEIVLGKNGVEGSKTVNFYPCVLNTDGPVAKRIAKEPKETLQIELSRKVH